MTWLKDRDENTRFFHGIVNNKRRKNRLHGLAINRVWCSDPGVIKNHIFNFFHEKYKEPMEHRPTFHSGLLRRLSEESKCALEVPITEDELESAIWDCGGEKAQAQMVLLSISYGNFGSRSKPISSKQFRSLKIIPFV